MDQDGAVIGAGTVGLGIADIRALASDEVVLAMRGDGRSSLT